MRSLPVVLAALLAACTDTLVDPSVLQDRSPDGRDSLFATGNEEEQRLAEDIAYAWLDDHSDRALEGIGDLSTRLVQIRGGRAHVRIAQELDGLPVFHAQSVVHVDAEGLVTDMTDGWEHGVEVDTTPSVLEADAVALAVEATGGWDFVDRDPDVLLGVLRHATGDHLAWRIRVPRFDGADKPSQLVSFVDAHDGTVIWTYDDLKTATCSATTSYNGAVTFPCDSSGGRYQLTSTARGAGTFSAANVWSADSWYLNDVTSSSTRFSSDATSVDAHFGLVSTLDTYAGLFGRDGMDGHGGPVYQDGLTTAVTHYGSSYANAFWDGQRMVFGDGDGWSMGALTALDVVGHEFTHGVTEHTAGLVYANQSGALNESMSDVFGAVVEFHQQGRASVWKVGEDAMTPHTAGDALRYMDDPARDGQSADHMSRLYTGGWDNGGVHTNSGIGNLAFQLVADGGRHPRR
ncbi:MAG: M4 family metallopeptidase, partial [Myxococcales bacterium]|nr:M4 family metallopeptidase [Myxococcales bacterium]